MIDIHSHVLAGIDDGARTLDDSLALCRAAAADGVRTIVATPHIREGRWPNTRATIAGRVEELSAELARQQVPIQLVLGAEIYFACGIPEAVEEGVFPTYGDARRYLLLELSNHFIARQVQEVVFRLRTNGITPVLAHPERNPLLMSQIEILEDLVRMGATVQLTAMSVSGRFGRAARRAADLLLDRGRVHFVASDTHHAQFRPPVLSEARRHVAARRGEAAARLLFVDNPQALVEGREVESLPEGPPGPATRGVRGLIARVFGG